MHFIFREYLKVAETEAASVTATIDLPGSTGNETLPRSTGNDIQTDGSSMIHSDDGSSSIDHDSHEGFTDPSEPSNPSRSIANSLDTHRSSIKTD